MIETEINGSFYGWSGDTLFRLMNGQNWVQDEYAYLYHYAYNPAVTIEEREGQFWLSVEDLEERVAAREVDVIETRIDGAFEGWSGQTEFHLTNGQVWRQAAYSYWYHYAYMPEVAIYDSNSGPMFKLLDEEEAVRVARVR